MAWNEIKGKDRTKWEKITCLGHIKFKISNKHLTMIYIYIVAFVCVCICV